MPQFLKSVDERAVDAILSRLKTIRRSNGYFFDVKEVLRMGKEFNISVLKNPPSIIIRTGHIIGSPRYNTGNLRRIGAAHEWFHEINLTIIFYCSSDPLTSDQAYRLFRSEIIKCLFSADILDEAGKSVHLQPNNEDIVEYYSPFGAEFSLTVGALEIVAATSFVFDDPFKYDIMDAGVPFK